MTEPLVLVNLFTLPLQAVDGFVTGWPASTAGLAHAPGFRGTRLHRAVSQASRYQIVNVAQWNSAEDWQAALSGFQPRGERRRQAAGGRLQLAASPVPRRVGHPRPAGGASRGVRAAYADQLSSPCPPRRSMRSSRRGPPTSPRRHRPPASGAPGCTAPSRRTLFIRSSISPTGTTPQPGKPPRQGGEAARSSAVRPTITPPAPNLPCTGWSPSPPIRTRRLPEPNPSLRTPNQQRGTHERVHHRQGVPAAAPPRLEGAHRPGAHSAVDIYRSRVDGPRASCPKLARRFRFIGKPFPGWDGVVLCEVLEAQAPALLRFTWRNKPEDQPSVVTNQLEEIPGGTRLTYTHTGFQGLEGFMMSRLLGNVRRKMLNQGLPAVLDDLDEQGRLRPGSTLRPKDLTLSGA